MSPALGRDNFADQEFLNKTLVFYVEKIPGKINEENMGFRGGGRKTAFVSLSLTDTSDICCFSFFVVVVFLVDWCD